MDCIAGCKYAIHLEDKIYADQLHALVPVGKKDLEVAEISHMFTLSKGVRSLKAEPKDTSKDSVKKSKKSKKSPKKKKK